MRPRLTFEYRTCATGLDARCRHPPASHPPTPYPHFHSYPQAPELLGVTRSHGCGRQKRRVYPSTTGATPKCLLFDRVARAQRRADRHLMRANQVLTSPIVCS